MGSYRATIEVLKLTDAKSVLLQFCEVGRGWQKAAESAELWDSFLDREFLPNRPTHSHPLPWYKQVRLELRIPVVSNTTCTIYTLPSLASREIILQVPSGIILSAVYVYLSPTKLLCAGGDYSNIVRELDLCTGAVSVKSPLLEARNWAGIVKSEGTVYILGGSNNLGQLTSAEKLTPKQGENWLSIQGRLRHARNGFTPFIYQGKIYCVGRCPEIETMDLVTEQFALIPNFRLPLQDFWTLSFQYEEGFIIVQNDFMAKYAIGEEITLVSKKNGDRYHGYWSNFPPIRLENYFYSILTPNPQVGILRINVAEMVYEKVLSFPINPKQPSNL